ncbi:hypothetical protein ACWCV5_35655, partial [Streptomyces tubercidicus]
MPAEKQRFESRKGPARVGNAKKPKGGYAKRKRTGENRNRKDLIESETQDRREAPGDPGET